MKVKKLLFILLLFALFFIITCSSKSYAVSEDITSDVVLTYYDIVSSWCNENGYTIYDYVVTDYLEGVAINVVVDNSVDLPVIVSSPLTAYNYSLKPASDTSFIVFCFNTSSETSINYYGFVTSSNLQCFNEFLYSSYDVCTSDGSVFFQSTPLQTTLKEIMGKIQMEPLQEILGILPVILITVVGLISLRKALQMLSQILHSA